MPKNRSSSGFGKKRFPVTLYINRVTRLSTKIESDPKIEIETRNSKLRIRDQWWLKGHERLVDKIDDIL